MNPVSVAGQPGKLNADHPLLQDPRTLSLNLCVTSSLIILEAALSCFQLIIQIVFHVVYFQGEKPAGAF